jgi:hypothetical protein
VAASEYVDILPGFAVCPNKWLLDKGCQATDIADVFSKEVSEIEWDMLRAIRETFSGSLKS